MEIARKCLFSSLRERPFSTKLQGKTERRKLIYKRGVVFVNSSKLKCLEQIPDILKAFSYRGPQRGSAAGVEEQ